MGLYVDGERIKCTDCTLDIPKKYIDKRFDLHKIKHSCTVPANQARYNRFKRPGLVKKAVNFTEASAKHIAKGNKPTPRTLQEIRLNECNLCDHGDNKECFICGCNIPTKASWAEQKCPLGKWPNEKRIDTLLIRNSINSNLRDAFKNASCFYIGSGPSLEKLNLNLLLERGIMTFAVNNVAAYPGIRPNFWCSTDDPKSFHECIWTDPTIMKFIREKDLNKLPVEMKNVQNIHTFQINEDFSVNRFFDEPTVCYGNHSELVDAYGGKGGRSTMYCVLRIAYYIGIRRLYLIGCDFKMTEERQYVFDQKKWIGGVRTNNQHYYMMNTRFKHLDERAKQLGYNIYNCSPASELTAFEYLDFEEAIRREKIPTPKSLAKLYGGRDA